MVARKVLSFLHSITSFYFDSSVVSSFSRTNITKQKTAGDCLFSLKLIYFLNQNVYSCKRTIRSRNTDIGRLSQNTKWYVNVSEMYFLPHEEAAFLHEGSHMLNYLLFGLLYTWIVFFVYKCEGPIFPLYFRAYAKIQLVKCTSVFKVRIYLCVRLVHRPHTKGVCLTKMIEKDANKFYRIYNICDFD